MSRGNILRKISLINREIKYYKTVYSKNINKIRELTNKKRRYVRQLKTLH